jgi:hypothetical protein
MENHEMLLGHIREVSPVPVVVAVGGVEDITIATIHVGRADTAVEPSEWLDEYAGV